MPHLSLCTAQQFQLPFHTHPVIHSMHSAQAEFQIHLKTSYSTAKRALQALSCAANDRGASALSDLSDHHTERTTMSFTSEKVKNVALSPFSLRSYITADAFEYTLVIFKPQPTCSAPSTGRFLSWG